MVNMWPSTVVGNVLAIRANVPSAKAPMVSPSTGSKQMFGSAALLYDLDIGFPVTNNIDIAMDLAAIDDERAQEEVIITVKQPGLDIGTPGAMTVAAGNVAYSKSLILQGGTAGYQFKRGQLLSVFSRGRHWLYRSSTTQIVNASNPLVLTGITRTLHQAGDVVSVIDPKIQGVAESLNLSVNVAHHYSFGLRISESR